jgi:hypothetical protein
MIRPLLTEIALFATPFAIYALYLWATRAGVLDPDAWSLSTIASLTIVALILMVASFIYIAEFGGAPPGSTYIPAHLENGKLVPGTEK